MIRFSFWSAAARLALMAGLLEGSSALAAPGGCVALQTWATALVFGDKRWGDLRAAIGEAAFMCGLERNADIVKLAAYAPLFANAKHTAWRPNLIYVATDGNFVNPSCNVQKLVSEKRGKSVLDMKLESVGMEMMDGRTCRAIAASAVRDADGAVIVKAVNCSESPQECVVSVKGGAFARAARTVFTGPGASASNDPLRREALREVTGVATFRDGAIRETLPPLSLTVYRIAP